MNAFHVLRAFDFALSKAALLRTKRDLLKPEVIWNIEEGLKLTVEQLERAEAQRVAMTARTLEFFEKYDLLLMPRHHRAAVPGREPLRRRMRRQEVRQLRRSGSASSTRSRWCAVLALSLPCGFTASGLPVGLQVVAPPRGEAKLLAGSRVLEDILGVRGRRRSIRGRRNRGRRSKREYGRRERATA